jgi:thiamine biosynthesis lipoprotein
MRNLWVFLFVSLLVSCSDGVKMQATGFTQGTTYSVVYYNDGKDVQYQIDSLLLAFDRVLSTYQESSYISKWNRNEVAAPDQPDMFKEVLSSAMLVNEVTAGAFDITVAPLMSFWFERDWQTHSIDSAVVDSILQFVGMQRIIKNDSGYWKETPNLALDVNAIAQGYSVDVVCRFLESQGIFNYLVEIGGEIRASGTKENNESWKVGIDQPEEGNVDRELALSIELNNRAMATSGNYRKFVEIDGKKYGHTLNAVSGYPATTDVLSATVFAPNCMLADAYATACMALGFEKAKELIDNDDTLDAVLIYTNDEGTHTWQSVNGSVAH